MVAAPVIAQTGIFVALTQGAARDLGLSAAYVRSERDENAFLYLTPSFNKHDEVVWVRDGHRLEFRAFFFSVCKNASPQSQLYSKCSAEKKKNTIALVA